jgi:hypothetical protein
MRVLQVRRSSKAHGAAASTAPNTSFHPNPSGTTAGAVHEKKIEPADGPDGLPGRANSDETTGVESGKGSGDRIRVQPGDAKGGPGISPPGPAESGRELAQA